MSRICGALAILLIAINGISLMTASPANATAIVPSHVQSAQSIPPGGASATTISATFVSSLTNGNLVVATATYDPDGPTTPTCSDSQGNSYTLIGSYIAAINQAFLTCYAINVAGGPDTVTVTFPTARPYRGILVAEYAGVARTNALDASASAVGSTSGPLFEVQSPIDTTHADGDLIIGSIYAGDVSAGPGFTQRQGTNRLLLEDQVQSSAGSIRSTATSIGYTDYAAHMLAFRSLGSAETATASVAVDPAMSFTVLGRSSQCNGQSATGFQSGSTATAVSLGHISAGTIGGGAQDISGATNAGSGFAVFIRTGGPAPNVLRGSGSNFINDVGGTHASPSSAPTAGAPGFGYTSSDTLTPFTSNTWAKLTAANESVLISTVSGTRNACIGYSAAAGATTAAGTYGVAVFLTAVPTF